MRVAGLYAQHALRQWRGGGELMQFMHEALPGFEGLQALVVIAGYGVAVL